MDLDLKAIATKAVYDGRSATSRKRSSSRRRSTRCSRRRRPTGATATTVLRCWRRRCRTSSSGRSSSRWRVVLRVHIELRSSRRCWAASSTICWTTRRCGSCSCESPLPIPCSKASNSCEAIKEGGLGLYTSVRPYRVIWFGDLGATLLDKTLPAVCNFRKRCRWPCTCRGRGDDGVLIDANDCWAADLPVKDACCSTLTKSGVPRCQDW